VAVLVGIDEAGYGPLMGPLVVSGTAFRVEETPEGGSLWDRLPGVVGRVGGTTKCALVVDDSKRLYTRSAGLKRLEHAACAFMELAGSRPRTLKQLVGKCAVGETLDARRYPWYREDDVAIPSEIDEETVAASSMTLRQGLARGGVEFLEVALTPVCAGEFNQWLATNSCNKAHLLLDLCGKLLTHFALRYPHEDLVVACDKQGGRKKYYGFLLRLFPLTRIETLRESAESSSYRMEDGGRRVDIRFMKGADQQSMPVALASIFAKYVRELYLRLFNDFWRRIDSALVPTAGYYTDGRRFWQEIRPRVDALGIQQDLVLRSR